MMLTSLRGILSFHEVAIVRMGSNELGGIVVIYEA